MELDWGGLVTAIVAALAFGLSVFQEWRHHRETQPDQYLHVTELGDGRGLELDLRITNRRSTRVTLTGVRLWPSHLWQVELSEEDSYLRAGKPDFLSSSVSMEHRLGADGTTMPLGDAGKVQHADRVWMKLLAFRAGRWPAWFPQLLRVSVTLETRGATVARSVVRFRRWVRVAQVDRTIGDSL